MVAMVMLMLMVMTRMIVIVRMRSRLGRRGHGVIRLSKVVIRVPVVVVRLPMIVVRVSRTLPTGLPGRTLIVPGAYCAHILHFPFS
jgi:hypothetical protein